MSFIYLASPYSHADPHVVRRRFERACEAAAKMMVRGHIVFSPVAHSHAVSDFAPPELRMAHGFWMHQDIEILRHADRLVVLKLPGWEQSKGIAMEIEAAQAVGIPVTYHDPD